jgi:cation diffusion facilitator family transporter
MGGCCGIREIPRAQRRVLRVVLGINIGMFVVGLVAGVLARSTALLADAGDMLGDALAYGFSLYVVGRGLVWQARAARVKGAIMAAFAAGLLFEAASKVARGTVPSAEIMGGVGLVALIANGTCLWLLWRRRADDLNMRSAWLCSRNDVAADAGVLLAAGGVAVTGSGWVDVLMGLAIATLVGGSAVRILREAGRVLRPGLQPS